MDRNMPTGPPCKEPLVALRKESVDRNILLALLFHPKPTSLSVRRAWIEIVDPDKDSLTDDGRSP